jgi:hypothetical protein
MTQNDLTVFRERLASDWLPSFCETPHRNYPLEGFKPESIEKLSAHDAHWFIKAIELNLVSQEHGCFIAPLSQAKEQIFWEGSKNTNPRPITLWLEPVITIGALAVLHETYGWPADKLGAQSKTWAFDLVGYGNTAEEECMVCEVKKTKAEVDTLIALMKNYANTNLEEIPPSGKERNAYKKVIGIRTTWPRLFWALGPAGYGYLYHVKRSGEYQFELIECGMDYLHFQQN